MVTRQLTQRRLTRDDWVRAALRSVARGGIEAVAVERIATELGATKGSFYWHFDNRDALVEAALELWERIRTDAVIEHLAQEPDPARRLHMLIQGGYERGPSDRVEIALLSSPSHPLAVRAMRRVTRRRVAYLCEQLEAMGWEPRAARDRALLLAYVYVGRLQISHIAPKDADAEARERQAGLLFDALVDRPGSPRAALEKTSDA